MDVFVIEEQLRQLSQRIDVQYLSLLDQVCKGDVAKDCSIYLGDNILIGFDKEHATQKAAKILFSDFLIRGSLNK